MTPHTASVGASAHARVRDRADEKSCPDIEDWSSHIYKQKSYTRIPTACFLCGDIQKCIEAYRPEVEKP